MTQERPILFSGPMVNAILVGAKTQTRRVVKPQPEEVGFGSDCKVAPYCTGTQWPVAYYEMRGGCWNSSKALKCPYGVAGERLWVRETWRWNEVNGLTCAEWRATPQPPECWKVCPPGQTQKAPKRFQDFPSLWRPSIFMPRWASRITLEITNVRVERLNEISPRDAIKEGINPDLHKCGCEVCATASEICPATGSSLVLDYRELWDSINRRKHPWDSNPWVWVIEFKQV